MFWRRFKLDWPYAFGELLIVTAGVLIALAINSWNSDRLDRDEQYDILTRVISDLEGDVQSFDRRLRFVEEKEESLDRLWSSLSGDGPDDPNQFLNDIVVGANYGWNQGTAQKATFNELVGSGKLMLITDHVARSAIVRYYERYETQHLRIDERETDFPKISYQLVPRGLTIDTLAGPIERKAQPGLSEEFVSGQIEAAISSEIRSHVIAEMNLARFIRGVSSSLKEDANALIEMLKSLQTEIK